MPLPKRKPPRRILTQPEKVRLFFTAQRGVSDVDTAKKSGVPEDLVWSFRDPNSRIPYKRELVRKVINRIAVKDIVVYFFPPPLVVSEYDNCSCGRRLIGWGKAPNGRHRLFCKICKVSSLTPLKVYKPIMGLKKKSLLYFIDAINSRFSLRESYKMSNLCKVAGERVVFIILTELGGYTRSDWRENNRDKSSK